MTKQNKTNKKDLKQALIILILALFMSFTYNWISGTGIALVGQWNPKHGTLSALPKSDTPKSDTPKSDTPKSDTIDSSIEIGDHEIVKKIVEQKQRLIIDVRPLEFYKLGHLPGALSFPLADFDSVIIRFKKTIEQDQAILVYCSGFLCSDSHTFAEKLIELNYTDVKIYSGGFEQWQEMGYEIEK